MPSTTGVCLAKLLRYNRRTGSRFSHQAFKPSLIGGRWTGRASAPRGCINDQFGFRRSNCCNKSKYFCTKLLFWCYNSSGFYFSLPPIDRLYDHTGEGARLSRWALWLYAAVDSSVLFDLRCVAVLHQRERGQKLRSAVQVPNAPNLRVTIPHTCTHRGERCCVDVGLRREIYTSCILTIIIFRPAGWDNMKKINILYENMQSCKPDDCYNDIIAQPPSRKVGNFTTKKSRSNY